MQEVQVCCLIDTKKCRQSHFPDWFAQNGRPQEKMSLIYKKQQQYNKHTCTGWIKKCHPGVGVRVIFLIGLHKLLALGQR